MEKKILKWGGPVIKKVVYGDMSGHPLLIKTSEVDWQDVPTITKHQEYLVQIENGKIDSYFVKPFREACYVPAWGKVTVEWPDLEMKTYKWDELDQQKVAQEVSRAMSARKELLKKVKCKICNPKLAFEDVEDFKHHLASNSHKAKLAEFSKTLEV